MITMFYLRRARSSLSRPDLRFVRTVQAPEHIIFDKAVGRYVLTSAAFSPSSSDGSLSGDLEELLLGDGLRCDTLYPSVTRAVGAVTIKVSDAINLNLTVGHKPVRANWYHGGIRGIKGNVRRKLKERAEELVAIDQSAAHARELARNAETTRAKTER